MKFNPHIRLRFHGDTEAAKGFIGVGKSLVPVLQNASSFQGLNQNLIRKRVGDNVRITASHQFDRVAVDIWVQPTIAVEPGGLGFTDFLCVGNREIWLGPQWTQVAEPPYPSNAGTEMENYYPFLLCWVGDGILVLFLKGYPIPRYFSEYEVYKLHDDWETWEYIVSFPKFGMFEELSVFEETLKCVWDGGDLCIIEPHKKDNLPNEILFVPTIPVVRYINLATKTAYFSEKFHTRFDSHYELDEYRKPITKSLWTGEYPSHWLHPGDPLWHGQWVFDASYSQDFPDEYSKTYLYTDTVGTPYLHYSWVHNEHSNINGEWIEYPEGTSRMHYIGSGYWREYDWIVGGFIYPAWGDMFDLPGTWPPINDLQGDGLLSWEGLETWQYLQSDLQNECYTSEISSVWDGNKFIVLWSDVYMKNIVISPATDLLISNDWYLRWLEREQDGDINWGPEIDKRDYSIMIDPESNIFIDNGMVFGSGVTFWRHSRHGEGGIQATWLTPSIGCPVVKKAGMAKIMNGPGHSWGVKNKSINTGSCILYNRQSLPGVYYSDDDYDIHTNEVWQLDKTGFSKVADSPGFGWGSMRYIGRHNSDGTPAGNGIFL